MYYKIKAGTEITTLGRIGQGKGRRNCSTEVMMASVSERVRTVLIERIDHEQGVIYWKGNCGWMNVAPIECGEFVTGDVKKSGRPRKLVDTVSTES